MQETRRARLQSVIQEEVSAMIQREIKDPRVPAFVTITSVEVNPEGDHAIIYVSTLGGDQGDEGERALTDCVQGLVSATPFFRRHLAKILSVRHIPNLVFRPDRGLANAQRVGELLEHLKKEPRAVDDTEISSESEGSVAEPESQKSTPKSKQKLAPAPGERLSKYRAKLLAKAESDSEPDSE